MYAAESDPYCYPGTNILKNRLGLRDQATLDAFEAEITAQRAAEPLPVGRLSYSHYKAIHRHLFQDVYAWAGKPRTVRIAKAGSAFCYPEYIDREMRRLFADLASQDYFRGLDADAFTSCATHFLTELNAIHPFREGNGRTQLTFLALLAELLATRSIWRGLIHRKSCRRSSRASAVTKLRCVASSSRGLPDAGARKGQFVS